MTTARQGEPQVFFVVRVFLLLFFLFFFFVLGEGYVFFPDNVRETQRDPIYKSPMTEMSTQRSRQLAYLPQMVVA